MTPIRGCAPGFTWESRTDPSGKKHWSEDKFDVKLGEEPDRAIWTGRAQRTESAVGELEAGKREPQDGEEGECREGLDGGADSGGRVGSDGGCEAWVMSAVEQDGKATRRRDDKMTG
jgi:hypothetical protein